jgi:hypothetical protein
VELGTEYITDKFQTTSNISCIRNTKMVITRNYRSADSTPGLRELGNAFCSWELPYSGSEGSDQYELPSISSREKWNISTLMYLIVLMLNQVLQAFQWSVESVLNDLNIYSSCDWRENEFPDRTMTFNYAFDEGRVYISFHFRTKYL